MAVTSIPQMAWFTVSPARAHVSADRRSARHIQVACRHGNCAVDICSPENIHTPVIHSQRSATDAQVAADENRIHGRGRFRRQVRRRNDTPDTSKRVC